MAIKDWEKVENSEKLRLELMESLHHDIRASQHTVSLTEEALKSLIRKPPSEANLEKITKYTEAKKFAIDYLATLREIQEKVRNHKLPPYNPVPLPITRTINDSVTMCVAPTDSSGIEVLAEYEIPEPKDDLYVMGDTTRIRAIVMNLFSNMRRALVDTKDPKISIELYNMLNSPTVPQERVRISVSNNGPRLPYESLEEVFKPGKSGNGSTGLGLAICRDIIEHRMGGVIYTAHLEPKGVAFHIELPLIEYEL